MVPTIRTRSGDVGSPVSKAATNAASRMKMDTTVVMASMLSSMLMEFIMPTTQSTVSRPSVKGSWNSWIELPEMIRITAQDTCTRNLSKGLVL